MKAITVELTDAEYKAFKYVEVLPEEWASKVIKTRCRQAIDEVGRKAFSEDDSVFITRAELEQIPGLPRFIFRMCSLSSEMKTAIVKKCKLKTAKQRNKKTGRAKI